LTISRVQRARRGWCELLVVGLSGRWLDGAVRQQCAGHLPFARRATVNGGFSIRCSSRPDPDLSDDARKVEVGFLIFKLPAVSSA